MEALFGTLGGIGVVATIGWIIRVFVVNSRIKKIATLQFELQAKLLERFESMGELAAYLESDAGRKLLEGVSTEKTSPYGRVLGSIQTGVILTLGGLALLLIRSQIPFESSEGFGLLFLGSLTLAVGLGFLISAVAALKLSRTWGLINGESRQTGESPQ